MIRVFYLLVVFCSFLYAKSPTVVSGLENLVANGFDVLKGKRVGLITNPTGINSQLVSTIDILFREKSFTLVCLFGPEHGVRGDIPAGKKVSTYTDPATGLTVYSLYGETRKPTEEMLKDIDVLVYDIQDIGCRSYTYISTMGLAMEAAARFNKEFVVLDRPNPLGGERVEGGIVREGFFSFVSQFPIPYVYGLTCGELARYLNEEYLTKRGGRCKLTVVPLRGWKRGMTFTETGLPWVMASPHVPNPETAFFYVATGVLGELGVISEGVGTTIPFQLFAAEWIDPILLANSLNALNLEGVRFRPLSIKPFYGKQKDKDLGGVQIYFTDYHRVSLLDIQFWFMQTHAKLYPDKNPFTLCEKGRISMFDKVCGSDEIRKEFVSDFDYKTIQLSMQKEAKAFRVASKIYHLY